FTDRLQHREAGLLSTICLVLALLQEALIYQRGYSIERLHCHTIKRGVQRFCCLHRAAAYEDRKSPEQALLLLTQQVITPLNGIAQCLLSRKHITRSLCEYL